VAERPLARVRGIYATAVTKVLLDSGFGITQPTKPILERFRLEPIFDPPDVTVKDLSDRAGVLVVGEPSAAKLTVDALLRSAGRAVVREHKPLLYSTYKGVVKEVRRDGTALVDIGDAVGVLQEGGRLRVGDEVLVCVRRPSFDGPPLLTTRIVVSGRYMRLIRGSERVTLSEFIRGHSKREELLSLGFMIRPRGWGVRWRSSAGYAPAEELLREAEELRERAREVEERGREAPAPSLIEGGEQVAEVLFPLEAKRALDEVRNQVVPTVKYHHYLKCAEGLSERVDFAEYLLSRGVDREQLSRALLEYHADALLSRPEGSSALLLHYTIPGEVVELKGRVDRVVAGGVLLRRRFAPRGRYDGISEVKEEGDYGLTLVRLFRPYVVHFYYRRDGSLKGVYVNINTPVELVGPLKFRYIDLEVDVVRGGGGTRVVDLDRLRAHASRGALSPDYAREVAELAERARRVLASRDFSDPLELDEELAAALGVDEGLPL